MLAGYRDAPGKHPAARLSADYSAIHRQFRFGLVGVHLDFSFILGPGGLELRIGVRAVFGKAHHAIRILRMVFVKKAAVLGKLAQISSKMQIVAGNIGQVGQRALMLRHEGVGHGDEAGGVNSVVQLLQQSMVFHQIDGDG